MVTDGNYAYYHGELFIMYINVKSLCYTPESNTALSYISVKKRILNNIAVSHYKMKIGSK